MPVYLCEIIESVTSEFYQYQKILARAEAIIFTQEGSVII